ncbi:MAG TPA: hypothetical protein VGE63_01920 [Candidatus Paceibacterota bacterium]
MKETFGKKPLALLVVVIIVAVVLLLIARTQKPGTNSDTVALADGTYCFAREQAATAEAPYSVSEKVQLTITGESVQGSKEGTQSGPDMTNGFTGQLTGTYKDNAMKLSYAYTVEGSQNTEVEDYIIEGKDLVKLQRPLKEEATGLVPDTSVEPKKITYTAVDCAPATAGKPQGKLMASAVTDTQAALVGTWKSTSDKKSLISYAADGTFQSVYDNEVVDKGNWEIITTLAGTPYDEVRSDALYLKEVSLTNKEEYYHQISVDDKELTLVYLERGNTNTYTKVK